MDIKLRNRLSKITTLIFDIDGVFTDCTLTVGDADVTRTFNVRDGYAIQMAIKAGYRLAIISGGRQESIRTRMNLLGIKEVYLSVGTDKKLETYENYKNLHQLKDEEVLFVGDDIPDLLLMKNTEILACCPADAVTEVQAVAHYISPVMGGRGVVREIIELVMKTQNKWLKSF